MKIDFPSHAAADSSLNKIGMYALAPVMVSLITVLKLAIQGNHPEPPFLLYMSAVMVCAWVGGFGPGMIATILSLVSVQTFFLLAPGVSPLHSTYEHGTWLLLFVGEGFLVSAMCEWLHAARRKAERAAEETLAYQQHSQRSEAQLRLLLEGIQDYAILMLDDQGRVLSANGALTKVLGYRPTEIVGTMLPCMFRDEIPSEDPLRLADRNGRWEGQVACRRPNGEQYWANIILTPSVDEQRTFRGFACVMRDVTSHREAEEENLRRARELAEANRLKDEFLATVSHELRTPLNSILGWAQLMQGNRLDAKGQAHAIETIEQSAKTQARLIEDLLDVSRIISGKMRLEVRPVALPPVIAAALDIVKHAADSKQIELLSEGDTSCANVLGDANRLQQVVWNLLSNAIKFTPTGGSVRVYLKCDDDYASISVQDTGIGIRPDFLPHIFESFRQADSSSTRHHKGLGLGLAIVHHLVELHGGTVKAMSEGENKGTTMTVRLPLAPVRQTSRLASSNGGDANGPRDPLQSLAGLKAVVVDDDEGVRDLVAAMLTQQGMIVVCASTAASGLRAVQQHHPAVLISDIEMPEENGYSFIRSLRLLESKQDCFTPAVALSAYARPEDRERALSAGFQMHLAKPIEVDELSSALINLLNEEYQHAATG